MRSLLLSAMAWASLKFSFEIYNNVSIKIDWNVVADEPAPMTQQSKEEVEDNRRYDSGKQFH